MSFDTDQLISKACEESMRIQDLIEENAPNSFEEFENFYDLAIKALDYQLDKVSSLELSDSNDLESKKIKSKELELLSNDLLNLNSEISKKIEIVENLQKNYNQLLNDNEKLKSYSFNNLFIKEFPKKQLEIHDFFSQIDFLKENIINLNKKNENLKNKNLNLEKEFSLIELNSTNKIKKNKKLILELENRIKKNNIPLIEEIIEIEKPLINSPSTIIHKTIGTQDQIRIFKIELEETIKRNSKLKYEIKSLSQDFSAMKEENQALKEILRSIQ